MRKIAIFLFFLLISGYVHAANVALVVKDSNTLSTEHERDIKNALMELGHTLTYVDKNSVVDYNTFDLIVIAGRPKESAESLDSFVASIPVNTKPTVAVDGKFIVGFGWASSIGTIHSTSAQTVYISNPTHPIAAGLSGTITVHAIAGKTVNSLQAGDPLSPVATPTSLGTKGILAYANSRTQLLAGKKAGNRIVFFGIGSPMYWTNDAEKLFKQSVTWALDDADGDGISNGSDQCPNTPPEYTPDSRGCVNIAPAVTISSPTDGQSISEGTKMIVSINAADPENDALNYTVKVDGVVIGTTNPSDYDWSFNSAGTHTVNVTVADEVNTVSKQVTVTVVDATPDSGFKSFTPDTAVVKEGDPLEINVVVYDTDLVDMKLFMDGSLVKNYKGYILRYIWVPGYDAAGAHTFTFNATTSNESFTGSHTYTVTDTPSVSRDVDGDGVLEYAVDKDNSVSNNGYEVYHDPNGNSAAVSVNGNDDTNVDFVVNNVKYWDPVGNIFTSLSAENVDNNGGNEVVADVNADGKADRIYVSGALVKYPDITGDVSFSNSAPATNDVVQVSGIVKNNGAYGAVNLVAELYVDNVLKDTQTVSVAAGETKTALSASLTVTGTHNVKVKVDTTAKIKESNEDNNEATKSISVSSSSGGSSGGSGGSSGGSSVTKTAQCTTLDSEISVDEGSVYALNFNIKNTGNVFLDDVRVVVSSLPSGWATVAPSSDVILTGRTATFGINIDTRSDGNYNVGVEAFSESLSLCKRTFVLKVKNVGETQQPLVETTSYPKFEITEFLVSQDGNNLILTVKIINNGDEGTGSVGINVPEGWSAPAEQAVNAGNAEEKTLTFEVAVPSTASGDAAISAYVSQQSVLGAATTTKDQKLSIQQSPLTGLFVGSAGGTLLFIVAGSSALLLFGLYKYTNARRAPWHTSISKYSGHRDFNPLFLLALAIPAYFLHPMAGIMVAGGVLVAYAVMKLRASKSGFRYKFRK